ncbi:hypothetical protein IRP63_07250 [Clostridium botulinum]|uniref:hypothetical protein n=1 Tax=Clostridium botulinum TaxID=1491 RepID=UPI000A655981|nr:hypothetical protein [Clostridium botulinum]MCD3232714.1 hypothetical protein [Clostridium botulinum D/C]MCD3238576.1 hypothetical protein [Clostridium botulinum D/C]MCD3266124.1 hypothetical protein [Clostridium botulinum D/C]MCD3300614.1 hypothetical protein [Clostridium botulinum D/C]MCD3300620.1 hypothetical protein [Clostridium botulinum D/C]
MVKILKIIVNYPQYSKDMEKLQNKAMNIFARSIMCKLFLQTVEQFRKENN